MNYVTDCGTQDGTAMSLLASEIVKCRRKEELKMHILFLQNIFLQILSRVAA